MIGSSSVFRKIIERTLEAPAALKKSEQKKPAQKKPSALDIITKGRGGSRGKRPLQVAVEHIEKEKKKKTTNDLKISGATSKKTKKKSNKVISSSGPGDLVI